MAGYSRLDDQVLDGVARRSRWGVGGLSAASPLDDQVLNARPRAGVPGLGAVRRRRGVRGLGDGPVYGTVGSGSDPIPIETGWPGGPVVASSGGGINWGEFNTILGTGLNFATKVLQLQPGVTTYNTPQGQFSSVASPGGATPGLPVSLPGFFATSGSSAMPWVVLGVGGLIAIGLFIKVIKS